jgi:uncharacterized protein
MDNPKAQLQAALKEAMKNKDVLRRSTIRMVMSAIKQVEIDTRKELSDQDVLGILQKEAKSYRESIIEYGDAGRDDLVESTRAELVIIEEFLPQQLSVEEVTTIVQAVITETGATSMKEIGKVMKPVMQRVKGLADGKLVNQVVREQLSS